MEPIAQAAPSASAARRALPLWIACLTGLALSFGAFFLARQQEILRADLEFNRRADIQFAELEASFHSHLANLHSIQNLMQLSAGTGREEFAHWALDLAGQHSELKAIQWCPRVPDGQRAAFEATARQDGLPGYALRERGAGEELRAAARRDEYFPVLYYEPRSGNEIGEGFDIATGQAAEELAQARDSGQMAASGRVTMKHDSGHQFGLIATLPVYEPGASLATVEQRRAAFKGCVRGVFRLHDLLTTAWRAAPGEGLDTIILDSTVLNPTNRLVLFYDADMHTGGEVPREDDFRDTRHAEYTLHLGSRTWTFLSRPVPQWWAGQFSWLPHFILAGGLSATLLIGAYVRVSTRRREVIETTVAERTVELKRVNESLNSEVAEHRRTEEQLRETQTTLVLAQRIGRVGSWQLEVASGRLSWSEETFRIFGRDPKTFQPTPEEFRASVHPADRERVESVMQETLKAGARYDIEHRIVRPDGTEVFVQQTAEITRDAAGRSVRMVGSVQDVTERRTAEIARQAMERKFQETQKLESLGVLAGGIAHDFNNLLTGILGNTCLARMELPPDASIQPMLEQVELSSQRAADLCRQMLAYSGKGRFAVKRLNLSALVNETVHLLHHSISKKASLQLELADNLPAVLADATQLRQIIMNLVINASDALGEKGGQIVIRTLAGKMEARTLAGCVGADTLAPGDYVSLEVTDTGCGMSAETRAKIFEPFFTTKFTGRGLGLSAVLGIVRGHQGGLHVDSAPGLGTTFRLVLPAAGQPDGEASDSRRATPSVRASGTVLVVDDEESVRKVTIKMLQTLGFKVLAAVDGMDALDVYRSHPEKSAPCCST